MIEWFFRRRKLLAILLAGVVIGGCTTIQPIMTEEPPLVVKPTFSHNDFNRVLQRFVDDRGLVDYQSLQDDPTDLDTYYRLIASFSPDSHPEHFPGEDYQLAYWINAYNAAAIKTVLSHYPITSIVDVRNPAIFFFFPDKAGFFFFQRLTFGGQTTSLYYLENRVIRKRFNDPRIHFALNCAALGCPRLPRQAFSGDALDRQLDDETRLFMSEERNFKIDHDGKTVYLSSIFRWYENDFTAWYRQNFPGAPSGLLEYVALYLPPDQSATLQNVASDYEIRFISYDWGLNDRTASRP